MEEGRALRNGNSNLSQAREAIEEAKGSLDRLISMLEKTGHGGKAGP
jgi:hypothetical protein